MPATLARKNFITKEHRFSKEEDTAVQTRRVLARDIKVPTLLDAKTDADTERTRRFDLFKVDRNNFDLIIVGKQFKYSLGQTLKFKHPRFGLSTGKDGIITRITENTSPQTTTVRLWV